MRLLLGAQDEVNALDGSHALGLELGVATSHHHERPRVLAAHLRDSLPSLVVGHLGDAARVDNHYVSPLATSGANDTTLRQGASHGTRLGEIQFAAQRVECGSQTMQYGGFSHIYAQSYIFLRKNELFFTFIKKNSPFV